MPGAVDYAQSRSHSSGVRVRSLVAAWLVSLLIACAPDPGELSPSQALHTFLTALDRSTHAPEQLKVAYEWIDGASQAALKKRAELAASLAGRSIAPWDMLVAGRASFSSQPTPSLAAMRARIEGDRAFVEVTLHDGSATEIPLVREQGRWRVVLALPAP